MTEDQRQTILEELAVYTGQPRLESYEFTAEDVAKHQGVSHGTAARKLRQLVADGVLEMRRGVLDIRMGKLVNAYRKVGHSS